MTRYFARTRVVSLLVLFLVLALGTQANAQASTISLSTSADPGEDRAFVVTATGTAASDDSDDLYGTIKPAGASGCGENYGVDQGDSIFYGHPIEGAYTKLTDVRADTPGSYVICAWLQDGSGDLSPSAATSLTVAVRSAHAAVTLTLPAAAEAGQTLRYTASGSTELSRYLYVSAKRAGGAGCGTAWETETGTSLINGASVQGDYSVPDTVTLEEPGTYLFCGYIQEGRSDLSPEAVTSATITVPGTEGPTDGGEAESSYERCARSHRTYARHARLYRSAKSRAKRARTRRSRATWNRRAARYRRMLRSDRRTVRATCNPCDEARYDYGQHRRQYRTAKSRAKRSRSRRASRTWSRRANRYRKLANRDRRLMSSRCG